MLIAQLSDPHITVPGGLMDTRYLTAAHLERAIAHLQALPLQPDVVWLTGDLVDSGQPEEYARLRGILRALRQPVFLVPGNHDARAPLREAFPHLPWAPGPFLQSCVDEWPVRMVGLDTLTPGAAGGALCTERLRWLDETLRLRPGVPTMLFMHHPPFRTGISVLDGMGLEGAQALETLVARHPQVERVVAGHVHRPMQRRFGGTLAMTCPSTAHQTALDLSAPKLATVMEPPGVLLHLWDPTNGLVTHTSVITGRPSFTVFDGTQWEKGAALPDGFYGELTRPR